MADSSYDCIQRKFNEGRCVVLDGAIGTELQAQSNSDFKLSDSEQWGFAAIGHAPTAVRSIHEQYLSAGCDVVTTNTYGILGVPAAESAFGAPVGSQWTVLARQAVMLAREAIQAQDNPAAVAFSIGGDVETRDDLATLRLLLRSLKAEPPDLVLFETLSMMRENHNHEAVSLFLDAGLPVWLSFRRCREGVCGIHGQLWGGPEGDYFGRLAAEMEQLGVSALLINCLPVERVSGTLPWLAEFTDLPLGVYPNLGRFVEPGWRFDEHTEPEDYADMALLWRAEGAQIIGGCCGVRPDHVEAMSRALADAPPVLPASQRRTLLPTSDRSLGVQVNPWQDESSKSLFPLPLPQLHVDPGVFLPTQGSYLVWKHLFTQGIGKDRRCLDIGCGAGLLSVQLALNGASSVRAIDIEKAAVANTLTNAFRNGVDDRVQGTVADLYTVNPVNQYDVVVASLYQMPTDPKGKVSGHRPVDYWGRNLLDHCIRMLPSLLAENGVAYLMQISLVGLNETENQLAAAGLSARIVDYNLYPFSPVFLENLAQIKRVEQESDAYHFNLGDDHVMVMYLIEARMKGND